MKSKTYQTDGYIINAARTTKFRTIKMSWFFIRPYQRSEQALRIFLGYILLENCRKYPNRKSLGKEIEENYLQNFDYNIMIEGDNMVNLYTTEFLNEKYTEKNHYNRCLDLFFELIFNPNVDNGFDQETFEIVKKSIISNYLYFKENPSSYAINKAQILAGFEKFKGDDFLKQLEKITPQSLQAYYEDMIKNDWLQIILVGDIDEKFINNIKTRIPKRNSKKIANFFVKRPSKYQEIVEKYPCEQSHLVMVYKISDLTQLEKNIILQLYNFILGRGPASKIFQNVREKNSLSYSAYSEYKSYQKGLYIYAGIDFKNVEKARKIIEEQVNKMKKGEISQTEFLVAKKRLKTIYQIDQDNQYTITETIYGLKYLDFFTNSEMKKLLSKVTIDDIKQFSKKIKLDTIFLLKGTKKGDKNEK